jgi:hypothetical protein
VLLDAGATPGGLAERLGRIGLSSRGKEYVALLEPPSLVDPPGAAPQFTSVGPSELKRFTELATQGSPEAAAAAGLLWSFRLRSILFSAYLAGAAEGATAALAVFHSGPMARLSGPFPAGPRTEFVLACRLVAKAWERAQEKGAAKLYCFVSRPDVDLIKPLGFRVDESFWFELFTRC